ncbi:hypothetical protein A2U01_0068352, partial [Trifolium medium]|nr:hypothetical protein [Trifolium medium]
MALYNAVHLAIDCCFREVSFESDCLPVIRMLTDG